MPDLLAQQTDVALRLLTVQPAALLAPRGGPVTVHPAGSVIKKDLIVCAEDKPVAVTVGAKDPDVIWRALPGKTAPESVPVGPGPACAP
jgi:hypothetical protein